MTRTPIRPAALRGKIFLGSEQVRRGVLTPASLRSSAWQRVFPDVYACSSLPLDHRRRARAAAGLLLPTATVSGRSAAVLWGVEDLAGPDDDVELTVDPGCRAGAVRGLRVTRRTLTDDEVTRRSGVRVTTPLRTALDLGRISPIEEAVICLDRFVAAKVVRLPDVVHSAVQVTGPGCRQIRKAADLADGLAGSPQEPGSGSSRTPPGSRSRSRSTWSGTVAGSSHGSTSPGPSTAWPWSTTACGTARTSAATDAGSTS